MSVTKPVWALRHLFAAGLRFDTEVQYRVHANKAARWCNVPLKRPIQEEDPPFGASGLRTSLIQCIAVVGAVPWRQVERSLSVLSPSQLLQIQRHSNAMANLFGVAITDVQGLQVDATASVRQWQNCVGDQSRQAIETGGMCLVEFDYGGRIRWASVVGVECSATAGKVCALLLLDSHGSEPWACGHNARLEFKTAKTPLCRHLTGEASPAPVTRMLIVKKARSLVNIFTPGVTG